MINKYLTHQFKLQSVMYSVSCQLCNLSNNNPSDNSGWGGI